MPVTGEPSVVFVTVKLATVIDAGSIASLNVAVIRVLVVTSVAPGPGTVSTTLGRVVSVIVAGVVTTVATAGLPSTGSSPPPPQPATKAGNSARNSAAGDRRMLRKWFMVSALR